MALIKATKWNSTNYLEVDLDRLQTEIFLKRQVENGIFNWSPEQVLTDDKVKFLVMSTDTKKLIEAQVDRGSVILTKEPYTHFLFGIPIAICEGLTLGRIDIVWY